VQKREEIVKKTYAMAAAAAVLLGAHSAAAQELYDGKTIELVLPAKAGGSYGIYGVLLTEYLPEHIPGNPVIVPNYMDGAGGMRASNYVANVAKKDGTTLYMLHQNTAISQLLSPDAAQYDAAEMIPIGVVSAMNSVMLMKKDGGAAGIEEMKSMPITIGSTGRGSYQFVVPTLLNQYLGTQFNIVTTYGGTGETMLAVERGEIAAMMTSLISVQETHPDWVTGEGVAHVVLQMGGAADPSLPDVPLLTDLALDDTQKAAYQFLSVSNDMARALAMPPGTPDENVEVIRKAFVDMMNDPEFQKAAADSNIPLVWADADALAAVIATTLATPPETVAQVSGMMQE
jgi:tripartite-type tricarboxylate transporter receptor subunit TctC